MNRPLIPDPPHRGGCLCGAVRYSFDARPLAVVACHCRDCRKLSGATNLLTVYAPRESFTHEQGEVDRYRKRADSGRETDYFCCAQCGVRVWHEPLTAPQLTMVAAGMLDDPSWAIPVAHIWTSRAAPSASIPEGVCRPTMNGPTPCICRQACRCLHELRGISRHQYWLLRLWHSPCTNIEAVRY